MPSLKDAARSPDTVNKDGHPLCFDVEPWRCVGSPELTWLASWYFEPSRPQRITPGLKAMLKLSPVYFEHKTSNHKLSPNHKTSPDTNLQKTYTNIKQNFRRISPFGIAPVKKKKKKHIRLGHAGIVDHSVDLSIPEFFFKVSKKFFLKEWTEAIKNVFI